MAVLAIWATKLLLKPGPDANSASQVGEVGQPGSCFCIVFNPGFTPGFSICILFFEFLVKFSYFFLPICVWACGR